ncbi:MAG: peptidase S10 [Bacteroidetes bacterium]|nr:peptidase S10 [Bacteroidota bacterium]
MRARLLLLLLIGPVFGIAQKSSNEPTESLSVTHGQVKVGGQTISYTATTGYMLMRDENDTLKAKLFFTAYTKDGEPEPGKRPILFAYNGGPGSASLWLHMGALGPKRVVIGDSGNIPSPPYQYVDNEYTWLDKTDIVFIDPMLTGFTRPAGKNDKSQFTGFDNDVHFVGDFIRLYTSLNKRWASPKFIGGESYGTTRSAGLAGYLQSRYGFYLNGVILISAILDFGADITDRGNDRPYPLLLPTFAATAWYHKKLSPQYSDLKAFLKEVETFALTDYASALLKGDQISATERAAIIDRLHNYTGISKTYLDQCNLRLEVGKFNKELMRTEGQTVGRLDSRIRGFDYNDAGEEYDYDPSYDKTIYGPYTAAMYDYMSRTLKFENSNLPYEVLTGRPRPWPLANDRYLNVAETLRDAMTKNPYLKVWVANGYYDMATPYFATRNVLDHMFLKPSLKQNIWLTYYPAGHMMYIHKPSLAQLKKDFDQYIDGALPK